MRFLYISAFLLSILGVSSDNGINRMLTVEPGSVECFFRSLRRDDVMNIKYRVTDTANNSVPTISFKLTAPGNTSKELVDRGLAAYNRRDPALDDTRAGRRRIAGAAHRRDPAVDLYTPARRVAVVTDHRRNAAEHAVRANVTGEYRFCFINRHDNTSYKTIRLSLNSLHSPSIKQIVLAFTVCGSRLNESLNLIKSVLVFTKTPIRVIIFSEENLKNEIHNVLVLWRFHTKKMMSFELHDVSYPQKYNKYWRTMQPKCSAQRLFVPDQLPDIDALIYVDTDTLFLGVPDTLWHVFAEFNDLQLVAMVTEHNYPSRMWAWYPKFAKHPFYGDFGLNAGVMLMNLTRMRAFNWTEKVMRTMLIWKKQLHRGDQDIINIIFASRPGRVLELSCQYNFRPGVVCPEADLGGILLLHGNRRVFHGHDKHFLRAIYKTIDGYEVGTDPRTTFLPALRSNLANASQHVRKKQKTSSALFRGLNSAFLQVPIDTLLRIDND